MSEEIDAYEDACFEMIEDILGYRIFWEGSYCGSDLLNSLEAGEPLWLVTIEGEDIDIIPGSERDVWEILCSSEKESQAILKKQGWEIRHLKPK